MVGAHGSKCEPQHMVWVLGSGVVGNVLVLDLQPQTPTNPKPLILRPGKHLNLVD